MSPRWVAILRYVIPALVGTLVGMWLEAYVWKGRH